MVKVMLPNGHHYHEPPYTIDEENDLYRRVAAGPIKTLVQRPAHPAEKPQPEQPPRQRGAKPQT